MSKVDNGTSISGMLQFADIVAPTRMVEILVVAVLMEGGAKEVSNMVPASALAVGDGADAAV